MEVFVCPFSQVCPVALRTGPSSGCSLQAMHRTLGTSGEVSSTTPLVWLSLFSEELAWSACEAFIASFVLCALCDVKWWG